MTNITAIAGQKVADCLLDEAVGDVQTLLGEYSAALTAYETAAALCGAHDLARKLQVADRAEAIVRAREAGLGDQDWGADGL